MRSLLLLLILLVTCVNLRAFTVNQDSLKIITNDSTGSSVKDSTVSKDTTALFSDSTTAKIDSLIPLRISPLSDRSYFISSQNIKFNSFRYTEDIVNSHPFAFLVDKGSIGNPSQLYLFGVSDLTLLENNAVFGEYDMNNIQAEYIDSIEILPLPRNILYEGEPAVNFIYKDFIPLKPYTRIKYIQGSTTEALFDGTFSSLLYSRLYGYLQVTNRKLDRIYNNSAFGSWQVTGKLKYLVSNDLDLNLAYSYSKLHKGLNGGVNVDSITSNGVIDEDLMYNETLAPVNYYKRDMDQKLHNFALNVLAVPYNNFFTNALLYYRFAQTSLNNINDNPFFDISNKSKTTGISLQQFYNSGILKFNVNADYRHIITDDPSIKSYDLSGISGIVDVNVSDMIKPSVYIRYNNRSDVLNGRTYGSSIGADVLFQKADNITLYAGYSTGTTNNFLGDKKVQPLFQAYGIVKFDDITLRLDYYNGTKLLFYERLLYKSSDLAGTVNVKFGSFLAEAKAAFYGQNNNLNYMPSVVASAGFYFNDSLFRPNLLLKTGFVFNFLRQTAYIERNDYTVDFTLAGQIRKVAVIYFTWENLLDRKYFIVPYYPMYRRNLRFGVSWELFN